jgi:hypothetical protein
MGETAIRRDATNLVGRGSRTACALSGGFTGLPPKKEYTKYRADLSDVASVFFIGLPARMSGRSRSRGSRWATARRVSTAYSRCAAADDPRHRNRASVFREPRPTKVLRLVRPFAKRQTPIRHYFPSSALPGSSTRSVVSTISSAGHPNLISP